MDLTIIFIHLTHTKQTNLTFRVYDRFGKLILETRDWTKKRNGTKANIPTAAGTYVWMLDYNGR
jgi:hypothetical protein